MWHGRNARSPPGLNEDASAAGSSKPGASEFAAAKKVILQQSSAVPLLAKYAKRATLASLSSPPAGGGKRDVYGPPRPTPSTKPGRERLTPTRVGGVVVTWNDDHGFIRPHQPIWHPAARKHKDSGNELYVHQEDVNPPGAVLSEGVEVTFFVYLDDSGIGAESCMEYKGTLLGERKRRREPAAEESGGWGGGCGGAWFGPTGPDLPRQRVTELPVFGEVVQWKGSHGWIKPDVPFEHPKANKHRGQIYVHARDTPEGEALKEGATVSFHLYADSSGLGAEEVLVF